MRISLALACVLAVATFAAADPIGSLVMENLGSPAPGLTRFMIYLKVEDGYYAQGFDGRLEGPMNQVWVPLGVGMETPTLDNVDLLEMMEPGAGLRDTHVMYHNVDLFIPASQETGKTLAPHEDNPDVVPMVKYEGTGTWFANSETEVMSMVILGEPVNNLQFMQVVVPTGAAVQMEGNIGYKSGTPGDWTYGENPVSLLIPEPTTLGLLALAAVGLVARRRR
ncbi:MAG: hypothetical protein B1H04_04785 [Planctomycetales bacterium 4484_123]|nr:MAG: hypothetical protein B1H04_04785 [Planctomycetales bacterium 4484_123]